MGSDNRFDEIRSHFWKFLGFWIGQILWKIWTVSLPLTILNSPGVSDLQSGGSNPKFGTSRDIAGIVLWALGFVIESVADAQKFYYKAHKVIPKGQPTNVTNNSIHFPASFHLTPLFIFQKGLWAWSRHPPYFGEIMCWWGIWILCLSPTTNGHLPSSSRAAQYGAIMSPIFTVILLMFGSGLPTAEKPTAKKFYLLSHGPSSSSSSNSHTNTIWTNYKAYLRQTSILIPLPPFLYRPLPSLIKQTVLLDFPIYRFDESSDGVAAVKEARRVEQENP
ncbi:hypothetical protein CVT25_009366 [Psilocybe cyanescens]|uniref:Steroid 5-alpha reductase C-terminal domain-containing protein n=1 Tax=Psilocybe cyanescens TaxID=93625 RepID=A0A409XV33_PSICY|nr:hypothetical protein CVT25_009366 [Psilocybe cyanescens]